MVGAGVAGLCCARELMRAGASVLLLEASDAIGGRLRTDEVDGFLLDRGFQVLLTAYPEAKRSLDYRRLRLGVFEPGSLIRTGGRFHRIVDPARRPFRAIATLLAPVGGLRDKLTVLRFRRKTTAGSLEDLFRRPERTSLEALRAEGFSERMIRSFFRPFLAGIFLEGDLETTSRMLEFVFRMFSTGDAAIPENGMRAIPAQLAEALPDGSVRLGARVESVSSNSVRLATGEEVPARAVVVATEGPEASRLVRTPPPRSCGTTCLYFDAPEAPVGEPILVLNGEGSGPVNNLCVPSAVSPSYAPKGRALVSASIVGVPTTGDAALEKAVRDQLRTWFGAAVASWRLVRTYRIRHALPAQPPSWLEPPERPVRLESGIFVCGDFRDQASLQGALTSGRRAAEAVRSRLS